LLLAGAALAQSGTLSGTVSGKDLSGTVVIACFVANDNCDEQQSKAVEVGAKGVYRLEGLGDGPFLVIAWRDLNANGDLDAADEVGVYSKDGKPALVKPQAQGINLRLQAFNGDADALFNPNPVAEQPPANTGRPAASSLVGEWYVGSPSTTDFYNPSTGGWAPASGNFTDYRFFPDGRYELNFLLRSSLYNCTTTIFASHAGVYQVKGNQVVLQRKTGVVRYKSSCAGTDRTEKVKPESQTYLWRIGPDPDDPSNGITFLWLKDGEGNERQYYKKVD